MGHYDNLRPENCPVCGQARGVCDHNLSPFKRFDFKKLVEDANAIDVLDPRYRIIAGGFVKHDHEQKTKVKKARRRQVS
jgi:hypothetical protein